MKAALVLSALFSSSAALAGSVSVTNCKDAGVDLTQVVEMRSFAKGAITVFKTDQIEPASGSVGLAVVVNRGENLEDYESFCKHVAMLSDLDLKTAKSVYNQKTNTLGLIIEGRQMNNDGGFDSVTLRVAIAKAAPEAQLVRASVVPR